MALMAPFWALQQLKDGSYGKVKTQLVEDLVQGNKFGIHRNSSDPEEFMQVVAYNLAWWEIFIGNCGDCGPLELASRNVVPINIKTNSPLRGRILHGTGSSLIPGLYEHSELIEPLKLKTRSGL